MKETKSTKKDKKDKSAKREKREKKDLTTLMNILMVVGTVLICAGLTYLSMSIQYSGGIRKVNATVTATIFTDLVAFTFVGALIMYGIRKLVLRK